MFIKYLVLNNFRNYENLNISLSSKTNIFIGDNAQGKTNILESLCYASLGKSHRTNKDKEVIRWENEAAYILVYVDKKRLDKKIEMKIFKHGGKGFNVNKVKLNKLSDLIGILNVVIFSPEDLKIVKESPVYRRRFLDMELCKLSKSYLYNLAQYKKILSERNATIKKFKVSNSILDIYDEQIVEFGAKIIKDRILYIEKLNEKSQEIHQDITSKKEKIQFSYTSSIKNYSDIKKELFETIRKNRSRDIESRNTLIGPHRDDFSIKINNVDTRIYGSQGQQRTAVLTIKFASLEIIKDLTGEYPVLLLDDVLSELDSNRQKYILNSIKKVQTLITCTGINDIKKHLDEDSKIFSVKNGVITEMV